MAMMLSGNFLSRLETARRQMRPSEQKLADIVMADPQGVIELTMDEIAARAGVSPPTVARFCAAIGCGGFREFKIRLARDQGYGARFAHPDVDAGDEPGTIARKIIDATVSALAAIRNEIEPGALDRAVDTLANAARIEFYGSGSSGIVAQDIQHRFFRLGMPTVAYSDPHVFCMSALTLGPGDVVVAISNSGRTSDILEATRDAISVGAGVVAITRSNSPLAQIASVAICVDVAEDSDVYSPMTSRIAHLVIGDALTVALALRKGDMARLRLERAKPAAHRRRPEIKAEIVE